jgi:transposase
MRRYEISDRAWARISDLLPGKSTDVGARAKDNRQFINAVLWIARSGAPWPDLPERYVPGTRSIDASAAGLLKASGSAFSKPCKNRTWTGSCSTRPPSAPTSTRPVKKNHRRSGMLRPQQRRFQHQDSCLLRCAW